MKKINVNIIDKYVESGYISRTYNEDKSLSILNYTNKCTFDAAWDDFTKMSRGLIIKEDGEVVAKCMPKFFNLFEREESHPSNLPDEPFSSYTKEDGSMIISYVHNEEVKLATRGSFNSDQALWAMNYIEKENINNFNKNYTYIFEVIYKENRVVTDYGDFEGLILLTVYDLKNDKELGREDVVKESKTLGVPVVERHEFNNIDEILKEISTWDTLDEGFVIRFKNGYRVKIKSKKYLEVFRVIKGMTPLSIWGNMSNGKVNKEFMEIIPEEFRGPLEEMVNEIEKKYNDVQNKFIGMFNCLPKFKSNKECAMYLKKNFNKEDFPPLIDLFYGKDIDKYIMKIIRPKGNSI